MPIAMPETGALCGTPATIRYSDEPQTEPVDDNLLPHQFLVDGLGCLLDVRARLRVLRSRHRLARLGIGRRASTWERQLDLVDDPVEEQLPLRRAERLRVLLRVGQPLELVAE